jgi:hypothetical protein
MIHESIRKLLGDELAAQVETALKGKGKAGADVDVVVGNDGSHVPAEKHEQVKTQATSAETALKAAAEALKGIGGSGDPAKISSDVEAAKGTIKTLQDTHKEEVAKLQKTTALRMALADKAHDPDDIISRLDLGKIAVDDTGKLTTVLDDMLKPIQETKPYLFKTKEEPGKPGITGAKPAAGAPAGGTPNLSAEQAQINAIFGI